MDKCYLINLNCFIVLALIMIPWFSSDLVKYLRDGAKVQFEWVGEKEKWIDTNTYEVTEYYEAEKDGQIIHYSHTHKEKRDMGGDIVTGREDNTVDSMSFDGTIRVYRENGEWKLARNAQPKDFMLLMFFPVLMLIFGAYFITCSVKLKKKEKNGTGSIGLLYSHKNHTNNFVI